MKFKCAWCGSVADDQGTCCDDLREEMCADCEEVTSQCKCDDEDDETGYDDEDDEDEE